MSMMFDLHQCNVRGCDKEPVVIVAQVLFCAEHALERERSLPQRRKVSWSASIGGRVKDKRSARAAYYNGFRQGAADQFKITEGNLRKLKGLMPDLIERLIADVHWRHEKLLRRIDRHIQQQTQD